MRTLIVSDIHSNIVALDAVLAAARDDGPVDGVWCLGDIVGYGPAPMAVLERLWELKALSIGGNHDAGVVGRVDVGIFNPVAAEACRWNGEQLTDDARAYLGGLPDTLVVEPFTLVHGSLDDPLWEYLLRPPQAEAAWDRASTSHVLVGHTHIQFVCRAAKGFEQPDSEPLVVPLGGVRLVFNPGSVGQPRDGDPRAAFAVYDDEARTVALRRAPYDVGATQRSMAEAGLPEPLISRLSVGR